MPKYDYYKKKVNKTKILKDLIIIYLFALLFILLFNGMFFQAYRIPSNSMEPLLKENNVVLVNKFVYGSKYPLTYFKIFNGSKNIKRGDVVVFYSKEYLESNYFIKIFSNFLYTVTFSSFDLSNIIKHYDNNIYIKRIIGIPKDKIKFSLINGKIITLINGIPEKRVIDLNYSLIEETEKKSLLISTLILQDEYVLKENQYYVLGDNRVVSLDSRIWGPINENQIIGKAFLKFWPTKIFGFVN